jgi:hypothetical protein
MSSEVISLENLNLDTTKLVFGEPEQDFGGKDTFFRIYVERAIGGGGSHQDEKTPLYIHGVESKNPEEWCLTKLSVFEKDNKKNHSLKVAFQNKFPCQQQWLEHYKSKIVDSFAKNLLENKDYVDYPLLEVKDLEEKFSHVGNSVATFKILEQAGTVETEFNQYDEATKKITSISVKDLEGQKFKMKFIVLIDGIFISSNVISIQANIAESLVISAKKKKLYGRHIEVSKSFYH